MAKGCTISFTVAVLLLEAATAFTSSQRQLQLATTSTREGATSPRLPTRRFNFFKDMVGKAFENDGNLSTDKGEGQYDAPGEEFVESGPTSELTATQLKWRETQNQNDVTPGMVTGTTCSLDIFLSGVPERDPSNDLYGSKVNISSRDRDTGLSLPSTPSTSLTVDFMDNGICRVSESEFTSGQNVGEWKLSDDGNILRFSMDTLGYTRTVETKGSIQKIYWTDEDEKSIQTQTSYSIPPGFVFADVEVVPGRNPGTFGFAGSGVLRLEKSSGLFGVSSKLVACGKFGIQTSS